MNKALIFGFAIGILNAGASRVQADSSLAPLAPGRYVVNVMPTFNKDVAARIEEKLGQIQGVVAVDALHDDSSILFTVQEESRVNLAQLRDKLQHANAGAIMTSPMLKGAMSTNPGL